MSSLVDRVLKSVEKPLVAYVSGELQKNKAAFIAEAKKLEPNAIVAIGATVIAALAKEANSPFFSVLEGPLAEAIDAGETEIIEALGGEDEAIYALLQHEIAQLETAD
jgi:hypothetical protein